MPKPTGKLTPAQHEIMEVAWRAARDGVTVTEIWEAVSSVRGVTRTTVLNQVDRLEKRHWLTRKKVKGNFRYFTVVDQEATARMMAEEFVDDFFGGSASDLVLSLLGSDRLKAEDVERLRQLIEGSESDE